MSDFLFALPRSQSPGAGRETASLPAEAAASARSPRDRWQANAVLVRRSGRASADRPRAHHLGASPAPISPAAKGAQAALDVDESDLAGFPKQPANFEEQQLLKDIRSATAPALKAPAHARLTRCSQKRGDTARAKPERAKACHWRR